MAAPPLNDDVAIQILLHLPLQSLLRFRTVSKSWRDVIDSSSFQKLHIANNNDNEDDKIALLHLDISQKSIILIDTGKSPDIPALTESSTVPGRIVTESSFLGLEMAGPVNGVICILDKGSFPRLKVCNPSLGQIKSLPLHQPCLHPRYINVGLGYDDAVHNYKVVQLLPCNHHGCIHASVYSKTTNSWRDLACVRGYFFRIEGIKSLGINRGDVAHWLGVQSDGMKYKILSFDMKSEVFRIFDMPVYPSRRDMHGGMIFAKGDAFAYFSLDGDMWMTEYEARFEKDYNNNHTLRWDINIMKKVVIRPFDGFQIRRGDYSVVFNQFVVIQKYRPCNVIFYSFDDEEIVRSFELPGRWNDYRIIEVLEYKGSFVSPWEWSEI